MKSNIIRDLAWGGGIGQDCRHDVNSGTGATR